MTEKHQGNDQVIAVFFKKSLTFFALLALVAAILFFIMNREKPQEVVKESNYQAPAKLEVKKQAPEVTFTEESVKRGINFTPTNGATGERMLPETMGNGIAFIDVDNDGDEDLFLSNSTHWSWNEKPQEPATQKLYLNDGKGFFADVSDKWSVNHTFYATGVAVGDVNNDGFDDLFVAAVGKNRLYLNQNGESFQLQDLTLDCSNSEWSTSSGFFDYDNDGDLDLLVLNYVEWSRELDLLADYKIDGIGRAYGPPSNFPGTHNCLFENQSTANHLAFKDVSEAKGVIVKSSSGELVGKSLALAFDDLNADGWQDIIVANDTTRNFVFLNQAGEKFKESGELVGLAYDSGGKATGAMGVDSSNYKNNDDIAVAIGNFANEMTSFYVNRAQNGFFTDESVISGIGPQSRLVLSFGLFFFDYDLDGRFDLFQTNGHVENDINKVQTAQKYAQKSQLFWNCGNDCDRTFMAVEKAGDIISQELVGRAAAYADIDNDGDWDVVVGQVAAPPKLYINNLEKKNWIGLRFSSQTPTHNIKISVTTDTQTIELNTNPTRSYQSQVQSDQIIGLGDDKLIKVVLTSNDKVREFEKLELNFWNEITF